MGGGIIYTHTLTTGQKFLNSKIFYGFLKEVSSAHQACIYLFDAKYRKKQ